VSSKKRRAPKATPPKKRAAPAKKPQSAKRPRAAAPQKADRRPRGQAPRPKKKVRPRGAERPVAAKKPKSLTAEQRRAEIQRRLDRLRREERDLEAKLARAKAKKPKAPRPPREPKAKAEPGYPKSWDEVAAEPKKLPPGMEPVGPGFTFTPPPERPKTPRQALRALAAKSRLGTSKAAKRLGVRKSTLERWLKSGIPGSRTAEVSAAFERSERARKGRSTRKLHEVRSETAGDMHGAIREDWRVLRLMMKNRDPDFVKFEAACQAMHMSGSNIRNEWMSPKRGRRR
jgi:hypothetical protein